MKHEDRPKIGDIVWVRMKLWNSMGEFRVVYKQGKISRYTAPDTVYINGQGFGELKKITELELSEEEKIEMKRQRLYEVLDDGRLYN